MEQKKKKNKPYTLEEIKEEIKKRKYGAKNLNYATITCGVVFGVSLLGIVVQNSELSSKIIEFLNKSDETVKYTSMSVSGGLGFGFGTAAAFKKDNAKLLRTISNLNKKNEPIETQNFDKNVALYEYNRRTNNVGESLGVLTTGIITAGIGAIGLILGNKEPSSYFGEFFNKNNKEISDMLKGLSIGIGLIVLNIIKNVFQSTLIKDVAGLKVEKIESYKRSVGCRDKTLKKEPLKDRLFKRIEPTEEK